MQTLMTRAIPENAQGELQGALASSFCLAAIIGPIVMTHLFSLFTDGPGEHFPGAPFIAAAALIVCAGLVLAKWGQPRVAVQTSR
jgi:DHA1 family tetracycline resistance protein-like MFS transporter